MKLTHDTSVDITFENLVDLAHKFAGGYYAVKCSDASGFPVH